MKIKIFTIIASLLFTSTALSSDKEFLDLQKKYEVAIERATSPINKTYETELRKLLEKYSKDNNLVGIESVTAALKELRPDAPDTLSKVEKLFVDKTWKTIYGSIFHFEKNGHGWKVTDGDKTTFMWRILDDDIVEFTARMRSDTPLVIEYIRFENSSKAYIGKTKDLMISPLTRAD